MTGGLRSTRIWRYATGAAVASVLLLLNALATLPATHHHGSLHDDHSCSVCQLQANGAWTGPVALPVCSPQALAPTVPHLTEPHRALWTRPTPPSRGPPAVA